MKYPLPERIGNPDLLVGRVKEFREFDRWLSGIPKRISKSRVILARRKSGKTAFIQRIFNRLWTENDQIIPFYLDIPETAIWFPDFIINYYQSFVSQFISFMERDEAPIRIPLTLEKIRQYGVSKSISQFVTDVDELIKLKKQKSYDLMWLMTYSCPDRYAALFDVRFLVILDEFQNIANYIYRRKDLSGKPNKTMPGSFHSVSESKIAPMLVTGSYVGWLIQIMNKYLEAGRLKRIFLTPYLSLEEGLQAVYKYAEISGEPVTNETAAQINHLCMSDPFFISCVIQSTFENRDLTNSDGVMDTVNYEISFKESEMSMTWGEYIELTLQRINDIHAKSILLHLTKNSDREWTPKQIKQALGLELSDNEIHEKLRIMVLADVIQEGVSDIDYQGLQDGTLNMILRNRFEKEISTFVPDMRQGFSQEIETLKKDKNRLQGMLNHLSGKFAEFQLMTEFRTRKHFYLSEYFNNVTDNKKLNIIDSRLRVKFQRPDGKDMEIDVLAQSQCKRTILAEVKKTEKKTGIKAVRDFYEKTRVYAKLFPKKKIMPAFLSLGGFTKSAMKFCLENNICTADQIKFKL